MSESTNPIDLKLVINKILKSWRLIALICVVSLLGGLLFYTIADTKYKHKTTVLLRNPLETDRNQVFSKPDNYYQNIRNFADEDHIDEIMAITTTTDFYWAVISALKLHDVYGDKAEKYVRKNLEVKRNSNRDVEFTFVSNDKVLGAQVVNYARDYVEQKYAEYFKSINQKRIDQLVFQAKELNEQISGLSDSILAVRSEYNISSQLLPSRGKNNSNISVASVNMNQAKGLEILQTLTFRKDMLVEDVALNQSLINQFSIALQDELRPHYFHIIQDGGPDKFEQVPHVIYLFLTIFLSSLFLGVIISLFRK